LKTKTLVHQHELDIEDNPAYKEDANKLMVHHTEDASLLFIRGCYRKGVRILSFDDGVQIDEIPKMHTKSILQILIMYDKTSKQQHLITCSKDKKIKVWDWMSKSLEYTLSGHGDEVNSICLNADQSMLFSASQDCRLVAWHTSNFEKMFEIEFEHPLYTIRLTNDNEVLVALAHADEGMISSLILEENLESVRLNFPRQTYENLDIFITNDNRFILIQN
jgi:WD40 repeat protein